MYVYIYIYIYILRSVLIISIRKTSNRGSQIPNPSTHNYAYVTITIHA